MRSDSHETFFDIGELSRQVGISPLMLRAWKLRYEFVTGKKVADGSTVYTAKDVCEIQRLLKTVASGQVTNQNLQAILKKRSLNIEEAYCLLLECLDKLDEPAAQTVLDSCISDFSVDVLFREIYLRSLQSIGDRWQAKTLSIAQEHFASNIFKGRLLEASQRWGEGDGPLAVLACVTGEIHEFPLIMTGILLHQNGWAIRYLGANTPLEAIAFTVEFSQPDLVLLSASLPQRFETIIPQLRQLAQSTRVAIAGRGATRSLADQTGSNYLEGDPISAPQAIARFLQQRHLEIV